MLSTLEDQGVYAQLEQELVHPDTKCPRWA